jgi:adenylate kinase family enzyme
MKIFVTGNAGSGKTTLATQIGIELGLPVFGLDSVVWSPGWKKTPAHERSAGEQHLISKANWVIDGVSPTVQGAEIWRSRESE